jgi:hypothetical protein
MNAIYSSFNEIILIIIFILYPFTLLGTGEGSHGSNPPRCSVHPRVPDKGSPLDGGGRVIIQKV